LGEGAKVMSKMKQIYLAYVLAAVVLAVLHYFGFMTEAKLKEDALLLLLVVAVAVVSHLLERIGRLEEEIVSLRRTSWSTAAAAQRARELAEAEAKAEADYILKNPEYAEALADRREPWWRRYVLTYAWWGMSVLYGLFAVSGKVPVYPMGILVGVVIGILLLEEPDIRPSIWRRAPRYWRKVRAGWAVRRASLRKLLTDALTAKGK
jgi:hypothetical protein